MTESEALELCDLHAADYADILDLWQRAGLHIHPEGRDAPAAFGMQEASGRQRAVGLRRAGANRDLVAVALLTDDGRKGWINRLAVDPAFRRRGLAQTLIAEAERYFSQERGLEVFSALILADNARSLALFQRAGYWRGDVVYVSKRLRPDA